MSDPVAIAISLTAIAISITSIVLNLLAERRIRANLRQQR